MNEPATPAPRQHAVNDDGSLNFVSPSQIAMFDPDTKEGCPRKWWFNKVKHVKDKTDSGKRNTGTELHRQIEGHLKDRTPVLDKVVAAAMSEWFPNGLKVGTFAVEKPVNPEYRLAGLPVNGRMDLVIRDGGVLTVWDNKTCGSFQYVKKPTDLKTNAQLLIYAHSEITAEHDDFTQVGHLYYCTRPEALGPRTLPYRKVEATIPRTELESGIIAVEATVESMKLVARAKTQREVPVNRKACWAFGGCPYKGVCEVGNENSGKMPAGLVNLMVPASRPGQTTQVIASAPEPVDSEPSIDAYTGPVNPPQPSPAELVLYLGCMPTFGPHAPQVQPLESAIKPYVDAVCAEYGVADLRLIKFAEGAGQLFARLRESPPTGHIYIDRAGYLGSIATEALLPLASAVFQALR